MKYLQIFKNIFSIIQNKDKLSFYYLQIVIFFSTIIEFLNVFLVYVFTKVLVTQNFSFDVDTHFFNYLNFIFESNPKLFLLIIIIISNVTSILINVYIQWKISILSENIYQSLSNKIYFYHMNKVGTKYFSNTLSEYIKIILHDLTEIKIRIFIPIMILSQKLFLIIFFIVSIWIMNAKLILAGVPILFLFYFVLFNIVKKISFKVVNKINNGVASKVKILNESFFGFREILLLGLQNNYLSHFKAIGSEIGKLSGISSVIGFFPRLFIETLIISIVLIVLYLFSNNFFSTDFIFPKIVAIGFAALKIVPALNSLYFNFTNIRNGIYYLTKILKEFKYTKKLNFKKEDNFKKTKFNNNKKYFFNKNIFLKNVSVQYKNTLAINNFTCTIKKNKITGISGPSGSGKSTLLDLVIGFLEPNKGKILIDGLPFKKNLIKSWQQNFFLVTQNSFLTNSSVAQNIAFGINVDKIDMHKVVDICKILDLHKIIFKFPGQYNHVINDMGIELSSGEKQRICLARALYHDKKIIVLDEATNALDSLSENHILKYIKNIKDKTVIIVTHTVENLKFCDNIILIDQGKLAYSGNGKFLAKKMLLNKFQT